MSRRRKDLFVKPDSPADISELVTIAMNEMQKQESQVIVIKKKIEELTYSIRVIREDFLSYLTQHNIDPNYPVFNDITSDDIVPDTVPDESLGAVSVDLASLPNIPNHVLIRLKEVLLDKYSTLQDDIEEYIDTLYKMKLMKAKLESRLEAMQKVEQDYKKNVDDKKETYNSLLKNLEKINSLLQNLLDFNFLFAVLPETFTSYSYRKFQDNYFERYSVEYSGKKKVIYKYAQNLVETYEPTTVGIFEGTSATDLFNSIVEYFGSGSQGSLPKTYSFAILQRDEIITNLQKIAVDLNLLITNIKTSLNIVRGVKGESMGNSVIDGLIASTVELSNSIITKKTMDKTDLKTVSNENYTINLGVNERVNKIKRKLQLGVENLDETFTNGYKKYIRKIALTIGAPVPYVYDSAVNAEDHLRDIVRQKYGGNLPFCDEVKQTDSNGNVIFTKRTDLDPETGLRKMDVDTIILMKKTQNDRDILAY